MATYIIKRKFYASESSMEEAGETVGRNAGGAYGTAIGAGAGLAAGATIGGIAGGASGWNQAAKNNKIWNNVGKTASEFDSLTQSLSTAKSRGVTPQGISTMAEDLVKAGNAKTAAADAAKAANVTGKMSKAGTAVRKAGKWGLIAGVGTAVAGGLLGNSLGKSTGGAVGAAAGNVTGGTVDAVNNRIAGNQQRQYAVSQTSKNIWGAVKRFVPKSKRMKAARGVVKADQAVQKTAFEAATNPGGLAKKAAETVGKNPLSVAPGYTASTGVLTAVKKGKLTTPDSVLRNTVVGKPIYAATEYTGRKLGRLAEPIVNSAYQMARVM